MSESSLPGSKGSTPTHPEYASGDRAPAEAVAVPPPIRLTFTHWVILVIAVIGFAYDTYALLVMPLIARPALSALLHVDPNTDSGSGAIRAWLVYIMWGSAVCGGVFGLLGGYLTDWFGRRTVLTWSILLYALSALASGFATSAPMLLVLRCTTFIGVCVEFIAAVAWLAELFPNPKQREAVLGYTQAFSSIGGLLITAMYWVVSNHSTALPAILGEHEPWRYALISGVIPAIPLIVIRPFLPESPAWRRKREAGTIQRPFIGELFHGGFLRTTLVTAALFACAFGAAFGAIQLTPQFVPGLNPDLAPLRSKQAQLGAAADAANGKPKKLDALMEEAEKATKAVDAAKDKGEQGPALEQKEKAATRANGAYKAALAASKDEAKREALKNDIEELEKKRESMVASVQFFQEIGGLVGRFILATLAMFIVSRRLLLWLFQVPGLLLLPLVFYFPGAGRMPDHNLEWLKGGIFLAGLFTVGQFSYWGNYLPLVYPMRLRGTGEGFAANVGGRMLGTGFNFVALYPMFALVELGMPGLTQPMYFATAAAATVLLVYLLGTILTFFLPEPQSHTAEE